MKLNSIKNIISILIVLIAFSLLKIQSAWAAIGDTNFTPRVGYSLTAGDLSRDKDHPAYMLSFTRTFTETKSFLGIEFSHQFSLVYETFYTLGEDNLFFPLVPHAQTRALEPAISLEMCLFGSKRLRPCLAGGLGAVYFFSNVQNYQIYGVAPAQFRISYYSPDMIFYYEIGARYRQTQNRMEGFVAKHKTIMPFFGIGLHWDGQF
jgi:hypothetical protein